MMRSSPVSIPRRYAKNSELAGCLVTHEQFQSLVGTLKTLKEAHVNLAVALFQSLVGTLKTQPAHALPQRHRGVSIPRRYAKNRSPRYRPM